MTTNVGAAGDLGAMEVQLAGMGVSPTTSSAERADTTPSTSTTAAAASSGVVQPSQTSASYAVHPSHDSAADVSSVQGSAVGIASATGRQKFARTNKSLAELGLPTKSVTEQPDIPASVPSTTATPPPSEPPINGDPQISKFVRTTKTMDELGLSSRSVAGNGTEADIPQASGGSGSGSDPAELTQLTSMSKFARTSKSMAELGISSLATQEPTQFRTRKGSTAGGTRQLVAMKVEVPQGNEEKLKWIMESTSKIAESTEVVWDGECVLMTGITLKRRKTESACAHDASQGLQVVDRLLRGMKVRKESSFSEGSVVDVEGRLQSRVPGQDWRRMRTVSRTKQLMQGDVVGHLNVHHLMEYAEALREAEEARVRSIREAEENTNRRASMSLIRKSAMFQEGATGGFPKIITQFTHKVDAEKDENEGGKEKEIKLPGVERLTFTRYKYPVSIYQGKMSKVYVAIDTVEKEPVVLRRYTVSELDEEQAVRLGREIELLELVSHTREPHIVQYKGSFQTAEHIYIVTENCTQGDLLRELTLSRAHSLKEEVVRETIMPQLLSALRYLHKRRIAHCDVRPENLFQTNKGDIKLGDFHHAVDLKRDGLGRHRMGMIDYMAPEMLMMLAEEERGHGMYVRDRIPGYDEKVDIWQVGILAFELLTGAPPFEAEDINVTAALILWGRVEHYPLYVTENAIDFIKQCLQTNPKKRPDIHALIRHPWLQKTMLHQVNNVVKVLERKKSVKQRLSSLTWLVPGFKDVRYNVAEVETRREEARDEHEYISEKDDGLLLRGMRRIFGALGLDKQPTPQEAAERSAFNKVGNTAMASKALTPLAAILDDDNEASLGSPDPA
eukprot:CAMPEP_0177758832 /NCGR_PEP_ID=MMETSP0491_2-20121128/4401_1 /TAXON_ID=63592 /ORGANISM="Tetraselmis chuii, Strain PLY429" /LENGTH=845 /DNA_ID=CAMNT_0019274605 /DNA_START=279 /DNA_END=2813 /DNA_ORIENTATION=+